MYIVYMIHKRFTTSHGIKAQSLDPKHNHLLKIYFFSQWLQMLLVFLVSPPPQMGLR